MDIEQDITQAPEHGDIDVLAVVKRVEENQEKLANRLGYLQRKIDSVPQGEPYPANILKELAEVRSIIEADQVAKMDDEEAAAFWKGKATQAAQEAARASQAVPYPDAQLQAAVNAYEADVLTEWTETFCQAGGINLTPEMKQYLRTSTRLTINPYTLAINPASWMKEAAAYLLKQGEAQKAEAEKKTPAEEAGKALGDGARAGGGPGRKPPPNWLDPRVSFDEMFAYKP